MEEPILNIIDINSKDHDNFLKALGSNKGTFTRKNLCGDCWCLLYNCQSDLHSSHPTYTPGEFSDFDSLKELITKHDHLETENNKFHPPSYKMEAILRKTLPKQRKVNKYSLKSNLY